MAEAFVLQRWGPKAGSRWGAHITRDDGVSAPSQSPDSLPPDDNIHKHL